MSAELDRLRAREAATRQILEVISRSRDDYVEVFDLIVDRARYLCDAKVAWLFVMTQDELFLELVSHRGASEVVVELLRSKPPRLDDGESAFAAAIRLQAPVQVEDLKATQRYREGSPLRKLAVDADDIRSTLQLPLVVNSDCVGIIALHRAEVRPFSQDEVDLLEAFAKQAAIALENVRQFRALQERTAEVQALNASLEARVEDQVGEIERMARLKRFLPPVVADTVVSSGSEAMLKSHRALLGVLFCDIRGFTAFCETAEPEETIEVLQTYHEEMGKLINAHGAGVDHRMGDGIMVLFNDPLPCDDPAGDAVRLAIDMRERMARLCTQWKRLGYRLGFGVGVSLGYATVGLVGFEGRFEYTASGTAINLAARICDEADDGEILLSPRAGIAVEDVFEVETKGEISLKGIREPIEVFKLSRAAST